MKKFLVILVVIMMLMATLCACNRSIFDTKYTYRYAYIYLPNGDLLVEGEVDSWCDYQDGDQIQVEINGVTYLTFASNLVLCSEKP